MASSSSSPSDEGARPPNASPLANAGFRTLLLSATVSYLGTFVQDVGERWLILEITGSALSSALVLACDGGGPTAVLPPGPTGGYLAVSVGFHHGCGSRADGTYCWGTNVAGWRQGTTTSIAGAPPVASVTV